MLARCLAAAILRPLSLPCLITDLPLSQLADGYVNKASTAVLPGDNAFDKCCTTTPANSFPAAKNTFAGGVQAVSNENNWGFDEETQTVPYVSNKGRYTGMCFKVRLVQDTA